VRTSAEALAELLETKSPVAVGPLTVTVHPPVLATPESPAAPHVPVSTPSAPASVSALIETITGVVAETTRYPREILEPDAHFEHDLGIDSVKLGEILTVLRGKLALPETVQIPAERFATIAQAAQVVAEVLAVEAPAATTTASAPAPTAVSAPVETARPDDLFALISRHGGKPFTGRVALVTGSGRGIGKDLAFSLAALGATVVVNAFHSREAGEATTDAIRAAGGDAHFIWASVANERQRTSMFEEIEQRFGGLDFLIANASNGVIAEFDDIGEQDWERGFRTNVAGLHHMAVLAAKQMARRGGGRIITMSASASHRHVELFACMGALKCAVESLSRTLAVELARYGVSVTCVSPGPVEGELIANAPESERRVAHLRDHCIGKRLVTNHEISNLVAFLLLGATPSLNGSVIVLDNGLTYAL
jgi:NAD(P)-dependent dehydrogenase (short-subunit alcohol dehydrogenase family)/acyl carrier protein